MREELSPAHEHIIVGTEHLWRLISPQCAALRAHLYTKVHQCSVIFIELLICTSSFTDTINQRVLMSRRMPRLWTVMLRSRALPTLCGTHLQGGVLQVAGGPGMSLPRLSRWCTASDMTPISLQTCLALSLIHWHVRSVAAVHGFRPEFNVRARPLDERPCCCSLAVPSCQTMQHSLSRCGGRLTPSTMPLQHARSPRRSRL